MKQTLHRLASLAFTLQFIIAASSHLNHRQLRLIPEAEHLLSHHEQTVWYRELSSAQHHVRRHRQLQLTPSSSSSSSACTSPLQRWFIHNIQMIPANTWVVVEQYNITTLAYLYKHYVHTSNNGSDNEYFGTYGERTNEMKGQHRGLVAFWTHDNDNHDSNEEVGDVSNNSFSASAAASQQYLTTNNNNKQSNVLLLGMHGEDLSYMQTLVPTLQQIYSLEPSEARTLAIEIQSVIEQLPDGYNNPLLTANAIATQSSSSSSSSSREERDSIIIGDGVFTFLEWLDLSSNGPSYIHSHEYAHHLQYDMGEQSRVGSTTIMSKAEQTRRLELMADVYGSYYAAHKHGGGYDTSKLYGVHRSAFSLGDCESRDGTHHGTPRQRECASNYGANLALPSYVDGGYRLSPVQLRDRFDEEFDGILSLDVNVCTPVVEESTLDKTIYGEDFERAEVPFYGDDGLSSSSLSSLNDDGLIGDSTPSYLEPELSWFDPKPIDYYDGGSLSQEFVADESFPSSSSYSSYEPYEPSSATGDETTPTTTSHEENNEWYYTEDPLVGDDWFSQTGLTTETSNEWTTEESNNADDYLNAPPESIGTDDSLDSDADDWFAQTEWGETYKMSSSVQVCPLRLTGCVMTIFACITLLLS